MTGTTEPLHVLTAPPADATELGLLTLLATDPRFAIVSDPATDLLVQAARISADLIVGDPHLDDHLDLEQITAIIAAAPESHLCLYTNLLESQDFVDALRAGARGYLLKRERRTPDALLDFLSSVGHGDLCIDQAIVSQILSPGTPSVVFSALPANLELDAREQAVVAGLLVGLTESEIADTLEISLRTVRRTIDEKLLPKFHARSLRELLVKAALLGSRR